MLNKDIIKNNQKWLFLLFILASLSATLLINFLVFHTLTELFSIVIAFSIFTITWNSKEYMDNKYLLFIGISFLFTGLIDLAHTFTYKGINIVHGYDSNLPTQLWIIARTMESISFLIAPVFIRRNLKIKTAFFIYILITVILLFLAFHKEFPDCYIENYGLTSFKINFEYIICIVLMSAIIFFMKNKKSFDESIYKFIITALIFTILSELSFTLYIDIYGLQNLLGHFFKILAFFLFYVAIVYTGIKKPYQLIFRELKKKEEKLYQMTLTDELTGIYNRRACYKYLQIMMALARRDKSALAICLIDLDNFKDVNDNIGHSQGDIVLKLFAEVLEKITESDYVCRIGGDEFLLIFPNCNRKNAENYINRISEGVDILNNNNKIKIKFSYGLAEFSHKKSKNSIDQIIAEADKNMYKNKYQKKN